MSILKKYILSVFIFAATFGAKAFPVLIKGHAPVGVALSLRAGFMNEDIALKIDASGYFNYSADLKYPSQFNLFIGNSEDLTYQFFIFSSSEIVINIPGPTTEGITATGLSERSAAFAKIEDLVYVDLFTALQSSNNKDSILNIVEKTILDISGIGGDNYTTVTATCAKIVLMNTLFTTDYKPLYNIYETSEFKNLPQYDERFSGFTIYNKLMWPAWLSSIKKIVIQESKDTLHKPGISEIIAVMDKHQFEVYTKIYVDAKYGALVFKGSQAIEGQEKKDWEKETLIFCRDNSEYPYTPVLKTMYEEKSTPIANTKAPTFKLRNAKGKKVSLKKMKGKYVVLDVWGSWCGPCRLANKELVTLYKKYASDKLVFLSVAYDKNKEDWEKTIENDGLLWTQLLYSPEFLDDYKIYAFPTVFIIGPDGKILKRSTTVSDEELKILTETINKN